MPRMDKPNLTTKGARTESPSFRLVKWAEGCRSGGGTTHGCTGSSPMSAAWAQAARSNAPGVDNDMYQRKAIRVPSRELHLDTQETNDWICLVLIRERI